VCTMEKLAYKRNITNTLCKCGYIVEHVNVLIQL